MHVVRVLPETFTGHNLIQFKDAGVHLWLGDVVQDNMTHTKAAIKLRVFFQSTDTVYERIFKGFDRIANACTWLFEVTEGEFSYNDVGPKWLTNCIEAECL